jgi:hypothetical protein
MSVFNIEGRRDECDRTRCFRHDAPQDQHVGQRLAQKSRDIPAMAEYTSLWKGGLGKETVDWLDRNGWHMQQHDLATIAASYGRAAPDEAQGGFVTAVRASD